MDDDTTRLNLHAQLEAAFPDVTIYYRPPGNLTLDRPCIVYESKADAPSFANNKAYTIGVRYQITILSDLPGYSNKRAIFDIDWLVITGNRSYVSSDIVHDVFTISVNSIT
ncbi:hypothetical protein KAR91_23030 [Candidatus Pacearchaeota archaeon]|nr:hypothetical protein [Candidatus Pacearchaeota archaeon]